MAKDQTSSKDKSLEQEPSSTLSGDHDLGNLEKAKSGDHPQQPPATSNNNEQDSASMKTRTDPDHISSPDMKRFDGEDPYWTEGLKNPGWLSTATVFLVTFSTVGFLFCWGTFQQYYLEHVYQGQTDSFRIAFVGTIGYAAVTGTGPIMSLVIRRIGYRRTMLIGNVLCPLGLFLASATTQLWQVYLSQGLLFGLGGGFCFNASFILPSQWFVRKRGLVNGVGNTGVAFGGMVFSPLANYLIQTLGYRNALRVMGCIVFVLLALGTALARARYPPPSRKRSNESIVSSEEENNNDDEKSQSNKKRRPSSWFSSPLISIPFGLFMIFALLAPLGYLIPFYLMPTYATQVLGTSESMGSSLVTIGNAANIICRIVLGATADRIGQCNTLFTTTLLSGIITMVMWQFATSLGVYGVYTALVGLTAGAYISLMPSVVALLVGMDNLYSGVATSWVLMSVGSLLGTPMFGLMQSNLGWTASIQFAGAATVVAALSMLAIRFKLDRRPFVKI